MPSNNRPSLYVRPPGHRWAFALLVLLVLVATAGFAQKTPLPPRPGVPSPTGNEITFGTSARAKGVIAGETLTDTITVTCRDGRSTVDLSVTVAPPGPLVSVSPTRVTTPGSTTLTFATTPATPSGTYVITLMAKVVSGACLSSSTSASIEVQRPIQLGVSPAQQSAPPGGSAAYNVTIQRAPTFTGRVELRTSGLPAGFVDTFSPNNTSGDTSALSISVPNPTDQCPPPNGCAFKIRGQTNSGTQVDPVDARLIVQRSVTFTADPVVFAKTGDTVRIPITIVRSGYAGEVGIQLDGNVPAGTMVTLDPMMATLGNLFTIEVKLPPDAPGIFPIRATPVVPPDVTPVPVNFELRVSLAFSVSLQATPLAQSVAQGQPAFLDLQITKMNVGPVSFLSVLGIPAGAVAQADRPLDPTRVTIFTSALTAPGTYVLSVQGQFLDPNGLQPFVVSNPVTLTVLGAPNTPMIRLTADPASLTVASGQTATSTITATRTNCSGAITLTRPTPLPPEIADLAFTSLGSDRFSARVVAANVSTPRTVWLAIGAQAPGCTNVQVQPAMLAVTVQPPAGGSAQLALQPAAVNVAPGQSVTTNVLITRTGTVGPVTLTANGLPAGISPTFSPNPATAGTASLKLQAAPGAPVGSFSFQVTGSAAGVNVSPANGTVTVTGAVPTITSFTPASGTAGTNVQIFGTNLTNVQNVLFNGVGAAFAPITPTQVNATVPGSATTGPIAIVTANGTALSPTPFIVGSSSQTPQITSFTPTSGAAGTSVRLNGVNLGGVFDVSLGTSTLGFRPVGFTPVSPTQIDALIPADGITGFFRVSTPAGTATSATAFQVTTPNLPEIGGFNPISGPPGTRVEITGSNLGGATQVTFNGAIASFEPPQTNRVFATVPASAATGPIRVTTPTGTAVSFMPFAVTSGGPVITGFQPPSGRPGDSITIAGVNFLGVTEVTFNGIQAQIGIITGNFVQAFVPNGATTGPIRLVTPAGTAVSPSVFTILP